MISKERIHEAIEFAIKAGEVDTLENALYRLTPEERDSNCCDLITRAEVLSDPDILQFILFESDVVFDEDLLDQAEEAADDLSDICPQAVMLIRKYRNAHI